AEGALRGWNMNGTAQEFYERGVRNAYIEDPMYIVTSPYMQYIEEYMQREAPVEDYEYIDPTTGERLKSVTAIGVKWNEADDPETKLEKIITQKYIALFPLSTEAWAELRRTGYPKLFPVLNTDDGDGSLKKGDIIRRIPWVPTDPQAIDLVNNSAIPMLGGEDEQATRLWWDVPTDDNGL
ncbi:MAG: SusD/RagB family nutrient-binding outer membrane lipoprotein, partial [Bacteroidaceae bacterium]|nr:SusD/RagB family nutrient-binding outer membrane lipoprotein [Bacteroidaceae bacterium]